MRVCEGFLCGRQLDGSLPRIRRRRKRHDIHTLWVEFVRTPGTSVASVRSRPCWLIVDRRGRGLGHLGIGEIELIGLSALRATDFSRLLEVGDEPTGTARVIDAQHSFDPALQDARICADRLPELVEKVEVG